MWNRESNELKNLKLFAKNLKENKNDRYEIENEKFTKLIEERYYENKELYGRARDFYYSGKLSEAINNFYDLINNIQLLHEELKTQLELGNYDDRNKLNDLTGKEWLRHTKSWNIFDGKPSDIPREIKDHPASFPPDLIQFYVEFFTKKGGWVLDPFIGIGSTAVACKNIKRSCWGTEINSKYYSYAVDRLKRDFADISTFTSELNKEKVLQQKLVHKIFNEDCRNIEKIAKENRYPPVDFCITSPPYWNILETSRGGVRSAHKQRIEEGLDEKYTEFVNDLGNITDYEEYLNELRKIFEQVYTLLKPKGYLMIILQNVRPKDGIMVPIAWDLAKELSKTYLLRQEFIWCQNQKFMGIWGYPTTYVSNVHHHYCLVLQKPE
ncbi:MAG: DNA methyltransferase [Promethearchaeota archaeon]